MRAAQMVDAVYRNTGYTVTDPIVTPAVVMGALSDALALIAAEADWPWLSTSTTFASVIGDPTYSLPTDYARTIRIIDPDGRPLERAEARQLEDEYEDLTGEPLYWTIDQEQVTLRPTPNAVRTYTHVYVRAEKVLYSDNDVPYLPAQWHFAAIQLAEARVHEIGRNPDRAADAERRYEQRWRSRMLDDRRRTRGPMRVRIRPGSQF